MKDPERLGSAGTEEERRLLRAAQSVRVPEAARDQVRRAVEARMQPRTRKRLWFGAAGLLVAATAAALPSLWSALQNPQSPPRPVTAPGPHPVIVPLAGEPVAQDPPSPSPSPSASPSPPPSSPRLESPPVKQPDLDLQGFRRGLTEPAPPPAVPPPAARLLITRSDRAAVALEVSPTSVRGQVRGLAVDLTLKGKQLSGRIGEDAVSINIFASREAHGQAGGRELGFTFQPTDRGWIVNASLPDVGGRVRLEPERLQFNPGCDRDLLPVADRPGLYEGVCSDDTRIRVWLPPQFLDPMARLVMLGMLLPEPEAMLRGQVRGLFPPPN